MTNTGRPFNTEELIAQIGKMNIFAISGGRVHSIVDDAGETIAVQLPVSNGYRVTIERGWNDTWTVKREYVRKGIAKNKGTIDDIYADFVGEVAYQASCFRNVEFGKVSA